MVPSKCSNAAARPSPPPPTYVNVGGGTACRVCVSVFRQSGGFGAVACNQLSALLSLPAFVGTSSPAVPGGQAIPFACIFVVRGHPLRLHLCGERPSASPASLW